MLDLPIELELELTLVLGLDVAVWFDDLPLAPALDFPMAPSIWLLNILKYISLWFERIIVGWDCCFRLFTILITTIIVKMYMEFS